MNALTSSLLSLLCAFGLSSNAMAAQDPIAWQLSQGFPAQVAVGSPHQAIYTFTNRLPLTLVKPLVIQKIATPEADFVFEDGCSGKLLKPQQQCRVGIRSLKAAL